MSPADDRPGAGPGDGHPRPRVVGIGRGSLIAEPDNDLHLQELVTVGDSGADLSVTWVRIAGRHRRLRTDRSTRVYVVTAGVLTFELGSEAPAVVSAGELVLVPRGTPYGLSGTGSYLVINGPAFVPGDDQYVD
jgi:mannose-6-phosphate isomerase-like protein (cupin superfamily)